jgi:hypothetical protein
MPNIKFSQLPNLANITANTIVPVVANNQNFTVTASTLQTYITSTTGSVTFGNVTATGNVSAAGNVSGQYIFGNGSQLTGLPATYSNAQVASYLASGLNNANIITQANVAGAYIIGDGSALTNVNLTGLNGYSGNITGGNVSVAGNIFGNIRNATGGYGNANVQQVLQTYSGSFTAATVSATGNITGNYFIGNGSQLTGINTAGNYSNANVAAFLPTYTGNIGGGNISVTGNIVAVRYSGDGSGLTNLPAGILAGNLTGNISGNGFGITTVTTLTSSGNITGANITGTHYGSGINLTGIIANIQAGAGISVSTANGVATVTNNNPTPYTNANVTSLLAAFGSNTISTTGNITGRFTGNGATLSNIVTSIAAGAGISINATTGAVTISATGNGGGGGGSSIANGNSNVSIPLANGNIDFTVGGVNQLTMTATPGPFVGIRSNTSMYIPEIFFGNAASYPVGYGSVGTNIQIPGFAEFGGNLIAANVSTGVCQANSLITNSGNAQIGNLLVGQGTARGNLTVGNIQANGAVALNSTVTVGSTMTVSGEFRLQGGAAPATSTSTGTTGTIVIGNVGTTWYQYVCVATNTWRRTTLSSF